MQDILADLRATPRPEGPFEPWEITQYGVKEKIAPGDCAVRGANGELFGRVDRGSLQKADVEGTMRLGGRMLNIIQKGNVYREKAVEVDGRKLMKLKPVLELFDPAKSLWKDVTDACPWGAGSRLSLIPFRVLAIGPHFHKDLYAMKVYIKQLQNLVMPTGEAHNGICIVGDCGAMNRDQFDLFVAREDRHIRIPSIDRGSRTICEVQILGRSLPAQHGAHRNA